MTHMPSFESTHTRGTSMNFKTTFTLFAAVTLLFSAGIGSAFAQKDPTDTGQSRQEKRHPAIGTIAPVPMPGPSPKPVGFKVAKRATAITTSDEEGSAAQEAPPADVDNSGGDQSADDGSARAGTRDASGVPEAGTVRVNNLANLEALLNIIANTGEIIGISFGGQVFLLGIALCWLPDRRHLAKWFIPIGFVMGFGGLALPGIINLLVAAARDANLFS